MLSKPVAVVVATNRLLLVVSFMIEKLGNVLLCSWD